MMSGIDKPAKKPSMIEEEPAIKKPEKKLDEADL